MIMEGRSLELFTLSHVLPRKGLGLGFAAAVVTGEG